MLYRMRRLRQSENLRQLRREVRLNIEDFVYPLFVVPGKNIKREIPSLKDQFHHSIDMLIYEIESISNLGIKYIMLFGIPESKDDIGSGSFIEDGIVQRAVKKIKEINPEIVVITDVCMCEYTSHGHCGILNQNGLIDNDKTISYLSKIALSHAESGADIVCPSDMSDNRVYHIRKTLDANGYINVPIMAHSTKFASGFYEPFRDACDSAPSHGDRKNYQMDFHNSREAIIEGEHDLIEGADILIVKPALAYLDIVKSYRDNFNLPIATYNVSGEYQMLVKAVENNILSENIYYETLIAMKRAGADIIITYFSKYAAEKIKSKIW
ncbi:MAG: porphobilinogen synthase [Tissierellia bacterium]|nr:porphobilinogen synthase [Tissierellia bacterium]